MQINNLIQGLEDGLYNMVAVQPRKAWGRVKYVEINACVVKTRQIAIEGEYRIRRYECRYLVGMHDGKRVSFGGGTKIIASERK